MISCMFSFLSCETKSKLLDVYHGKNPLEGDEQFDSLLYLKKSEEIIYDRVNKVSVIFALNGSSLTG